MTLSASPIFPQAPPERSSSARVEGQLKVSGQIQYSADFQMPDALQATVVRSPYPHARIKSIDTTAAAQAPGVLAVITGADLAGLRFGRSVHDIPVLAEEKVRFIGEMVAAVAAETREQSEEAAMLIQVDYEPLPAVFDAAEALKPDAPAVHDAPWSYRNAVSTEEGPINLLGHSVAEAGGDIEAALAASDHVFEQTFTTQAHHHGYIEPHSCTVKVEEGNHVNIWANNKSPYQLRNQLSAAFGIPVEQITVHIPAVGGDFGGKGTPMDIPLCLELSKRTGRAVRMTMRYTEELIAAAPRHASAATLRVGVSNDGRLQAVDMYIVYNSGAYGGFRPGVNFGARLVTSYNVPTVRCVADRVYTNQVPGGNARAPGAPQATFALESMIDLVARNLGIDSFTFRRNNVLREGEATPYDEHYPEMRSLEVLDLAEQSYRPAFPKDAPRSVRFGRGISVYDRATHAPQRTSMRLRLRDDGTVEAQVPVMETGTGSHTILRRVVADGLTLPYDQVIIRYVGTDDLPWDSGVGGSRVTISGAEVAHTSAVAFKEEVAQRMAQSLGIPRERLELSDGLVGTDPASGRTVTLAQISASGTPLEMVQETGLTRGDEAVTTFCAQVAQVGVDVETGQVYLYEVLSAQDVAEVLDPASHDGQIEGGVVTGIGFALTEDLGIEDGQVTAAHLGDYKLPTMPDAATLRTLNLEGSMGIGARNIKAIGELTNVPTAAAIANAVADAVGVRVTDLPITAEKVYRLLHERQ